MKRRLLSTLMVLCLILTMLPSTVWAAGNTDWLAEYMKGWAYTVTNLNTQSEIQNDATIDFGEFEYGESATAQTITPVRLKFENVSQREINLTFGSVRDFSCTWDDPSKAGKLTPGQSNILTISVRDGIKNNDTEQNEPIPAGEKTDILMMMEQNSRVGVHVNLKLTVKPKNLKVTALQYNNGTGVTIADKTITKGYGKKISPADLSVQTESGTKTLQELGASLTTADHKNPLSEYAETGEYSCTLKSDNYTFENGSVTVRVEKSNLECVYVSASSIIEGSKLLNSTLTGKFINEYSGREVSGTLSWTDPTDKTFQVDDSSYKVFTPQYKFTATDSKFYNDFTGTTDLVVRKTDYSVNPDVSSKKLTPDKEVLTCEYDAKPHPITFYYDGSVATNTTITYYNRSSKTTSSNAPVDVGVYDVVAERGGYYAYSTVTIQPRDLTLNTLSDFISSRPYNGSADATSSLREDLAKQSMNSYVYAADRGKVSIQSWDISATYADEFCEAPKTATITIENVVLTGDKASNYTFTNKTLTKDVNSGIFKRPVKLTLNNELSKFYGQSFEFVPSDFIPAKDSGYSCNSGLTGLDSIEDLQVIAQSAGADPSARTGQYSITAYGSSPNYSVSRVDGKLTVNKTTPYEVSVACGYGKVGTHLSTIESSLQGTFINPYSGAAVPGTVTWENPNETLPAEAGQSAEYDYIFTPDDTTDYVSASGTVKVTAVEKSPVPIEIDNSSTSVVYNGSPQNIKVSAQGTITTEYYQGESKLNGAPKEVGAYTAKVHVNVLPTDSWYDNEVTVGMVITKANPGGSATASEVAEGNMLSSSVLTLNFTGVNGEKLDGTVSWDTVNMVDDPSSVHVSPGTAYSWTFTPNNSNYNEVKGSSVVLAAKADATDVPNEYVTDPPKVDDDPSPVQPDNPGGTTPGGTTPGETTPGGTTPGGTTPGETTPGGTTPGETTPGGTTPGGTTPGETTPGGTTPGEMTPGETTPGGSTSGGTTPGETTPGETTPGGTTPGETTPGGSTPGGSTSGGTTPGETTPGGSDTPGSTTPGQSENPGGETPSQPENPGSGTSEPSVTLKPDSYPENNANITTQTVTDGIKEAQKNHSDAVVLSPQFNSVNGNVSVSVPRNSISEVEKAGLDLTIESGLGNVTLPPASLKDLSRMDGSRMNIRLEAGEGGTTKIEVKVGNDVVDHLSGGMTVDVPAAAGNVLVLVAPDGTETLIRKSIAAGNQIRALLDGSCTVKVVERSPKFQDVLGDDSFNDAVSFATSRALFQGVTTDTFAPETSMTRAMLATVLWRLENESKPDSSGTFADIPSDSWFSESVAWAMERGIVQGYGDGTFGPDDNITREQLATMLFRYAQQAGMNTKAAGDLTGYSDQDSVSAHAQEAMQWAITNDLLDGTDSGTLDPGGSVSRAKVAGIIERLIRLMFA